MAGNKSAKDTPASKSVAPASDDQAISPSVSMGGVFATLDSGLAEKKKRKQNTKPTGDSVATTVPDSTDVQPPSSSHASTSQSKSGGSETVKAAEQEPDKSRAPTPAKVGRPLSAAGSFAPKAAYLDSFVITPAETARLIAAKERSLHQDQSGTGPSSPATAEVPGMVSDTQMTVSHLM